MLWAVAVHDGQYDGWCRRASNIAAWLAIIHNSISIGLDFSFLAI
jgi:hypothetical protein